jgi:hypothetical protein
VRPQVRKGCSRFPFDRRKCLICATSHRASAQHFGEGSDGIGGIGGGHPLKCRDCSKQAANESWVQPLSYTSPDSLPLAADVSATGHAHKSCTGRQSLSRGICVSESVKAAGFQTLWRVAYTVRIRARRGALGAQQEVSWT